MRPGAGGFYVPLNQVDSTLAVGTVVRVTKLEMKEDRIELFLKGVPGDAYAKLKVILGKGFEGSYNLEAVLGIVSRALRLERFERLQTLKAEYPQLKEKLATAESRYKAAQGDARSRVQAAQQFQSALQELVKNRTDYDSLTQTASDPERDQYARQAADLEKSIQALDQEAKKQRAEEIRKTLSAEAEEAAHIRAQLRQKKPGSLAEWEQQMAFLQRWEELLHRCQTLHGELAETGEGAPASETAALQQGFQEIQTLRAALEGQRQTLRLVELDNQYREMDRQRRQLMDAYTRVFGTPRQRPGGEKLYIHLHQMNENRTEAQHLGSEQAAGQAAGLQKEMDRLQRQIGPVQVPARSTPPATLRTRPPSPTGSEAPPPAVLGSAGPKRIRVAGSVIAGKLIFQPQPEYPPLARMARIQGEVRLEVVVDKEATVQDVKVLSGHPLLVKAAIEAVSRWRYQPTLFQGQPVEVLTEVEQGFSLTD
jgi:TonB family protein